MSIRTRPVHVLPWFAALSLCVVGCQSLKTETPTNYEALQDASDAHLAYQRGDCDTVSRLAKQERLRGWKANETLFSMYLLDGFCKELAGDSQAARDVYAKIIEIQPSSFSALDARERERSIRINQSDPDHASWLAQMRKRAMRAHATRQPVERKPADFPPVARTTGIEGYAVVEFGVTPLGDTSDAVIIDSKPPFLFDGAALRAVQNWKYKRISSASKNDIQVIKLVFVRGDPEAIPTTAKEMAPAVDSGTNADE